MTQTKFTPGPWIHETNFKLYEKDRYNSIIAGKGFESEELKCSGFNLTGIMTDADAKLISCAPELFEALESLTNWVSSLKDWSGGNELDPPIETAKKVLQKVTE